MKWVVITYTFLFQLGMFEQNMDMDTCSIYLISLTNQIEKKTDSVVVKFEYSMSESLLSSLECSNLIAPKILGQLKRKLNNLEFTQEVCDKVHSKLIDWKVYSNTNSLSEYVLINMSEPIFIDSSEAYLFFDHLNIRAGRGVAGGGSMMQIYCKKDDQWYLKTTKVLEMY